MEGQLLEHRIASCKQDDSSSADGGALQAAAHTPGDADDGKQLSVLLEQTRGNGVAV